MTLLINPGSHIGEPGDGWTNTHQHAETEARQWLATMHAKGMTDVILRSPSPQHHRDGRWSFYFEHTITGVVIELETHGIDNLNAYEKQHIFGPRVYWNGSSISEPELEDFAADGYRPVRTYTACNTTATSSDTPSDRGRPGNDTEEVNR